MGDHKYTLDEIDRMREALLRKHNDMIPSSFGIGPDGPEPSAMRAFERREKVVEDQLRTCMIGGVRPEELEAKYPLKKSA